MSSPELFGDGHRAGSARDRQGSPCRGNSPTTRSQTQKRPFTPCPGHFSAPEPLTDTLLWSCLPGLRWQEEEGERKACQLLSLLSRQDFPASSLLVPAAAQSPLNKAPCNPSEVLLPIHAPQELCLSTKSLKPSPNHLISISSTSLSSVTFLLTTVSADNSLTSLSAGVAQLLSWHCSHSRRDTQGSTRRVQTGMEEQQRSSCSPEPPAAPLVSH